MALEGTVIDGAVIPDSGLRLPEGARVRFELVEELDEDNIDLIDATLPDDHPDAPYDRVKELAILRESIDAMNAGEVGIPLDEAMAQIARNLNLPSSRRE